MVAVRNFIAGALVTIHDILACAPQTLALHVQRSDRSGMGGVHAEELLALFSYSLDLLTHRVKYRVLFIVDHRHHHSRHKLTITFGLGLALKKLLHFSFFALPNLKVFLSAYRKLLQLTLGLGWEHL